MTLERVREIICMFEDDPAYSDEEVSELIALARLAEERQLLEQMGESYGNGLEIQKHGPNSWVCSYGNIVDDKMTFGRTLGEAIRKAAGVGDD